jgi:hypothetical protein
MAFTTKSISDGDPHWPFPFAAIRTTRLSVRLASWLPRLLPRSLFLPGIMGKKFAAQTESCVVDEKVHMNTARFRLFRDSLRTALISKIDAENGALILRQVTKESQISLFRYFDKGNFAVVLKNFAVLQSGCVMMCGFVAWLVSVLIHIQFLAEGSLWFSVFFQWAGTYLGAKRDCLEAL